jgi:AraC-like DNA-binding protein
MSARALARQLNVSVRTLHRRLGQVGCAFGDLVDEARHRRAVALLRDPGLRTAAIAEDLGFAELSSFYRAFRRWTGRTPNVVRQELLSEANNVGRAVEQAGR